jgi:hypothetical protein
VTALPPPAIIPLGHPLLTGSSDLPEGSNAPSRHEIPSYLVLLRVGFAVPRALLRGRCALTAPFHPYPGLAAEAVCFLLRFPSDGLETAIPDVIRHTALWSSDFPLSSREGSDHPVQYQLLTIIDVSSPIMMQFSRGLRFLLVLFWPKRSVRFIRVNH